MPFNEIIGQERWKHILSHSIKNQRLSHAYLFLGPENTGKRHAAIIFAKSLLCRDFKEDPCRKCPSCIKIQNLAHPDLLLIEPEKNIIAIETIRNTKKFVGFKPFEGDRKIIIINRADKMTKEAANSLLKTLEEPPQDTIIILLSPHSYALYPTIVSRCQKIVLNLLPPPLIKDFLIKEHSIEPEKAEQISLISGGRIGKALYLKENLDLKKRNMAQEMLFGLFSKKIDVIFKTAKDLSKEKEGLDEIFDWLSLLVRDTALLCSGADIDHIINRDIAGDIKRFSENLSSPSTYKIYEIIKSTRLLLKSNVNPQLALENMMLDISGLKRKGAMLPTWSQS